MADLLTAPAGVESRKETNQQMHSSLPDVVRLHRLATGRVK